MIIIVPSFTSLTTRMIDQSTVRASEAAVDWALMQGLAFKQAPDVAVHVPFSLTPQPIHAETFTRMQDTSILLSRLVYAISQDHDFVTQVIEPVASASPFFRRLLELHEQTRNAPRKPLLIMRSDFMNDARYGPQLVETNGVAAGMGPFGQITHELHAYIKTQWQAPYDQWSYAPEANLIHNPAIERISSAIAGAATGVRDEFQSSDTPLFVMVTQTDEDNVFDQHLLEHALHQLGVRTARRTLAELARSMTTGSGGRLILRDLGPVDSVYFRTGYAFADYASEDYASEEEQTCCRELLQARAFIEQHRVSVNATVSQQLATSKRMQLVLSKMSEAELMRFGLAFEEAALVKSVLPRMEPICSDTPKWVKQQNVSHWVLKNQGEGGGHCSSEQQLLSQIDQLQASDYPAWLLMERLYPEPIGPTPVVSRGRLQVVEELVSEIGVFTVQDSETRAAKPGYAGYLVRSKPIDALEGGVHSGLGVLNSLSGVH